MEKNNLISIITPTYNRGSTISRVFKSLKNQTYKNFEWIIIDDGSEDNTKEVIYEFKKQATFPIIYVYQKNQGKHIATNKALNLCNGEYCTVIDSDDEIRNSSLEILINEWNSIPKEDIKKYKSVIARCYNPRTGKTIGKPMKSKKMDCSSLDAKYKYKMNYEKWGLSRTEVEKEFLSPSTEGHFFPEAIIQDLQARKYIIRYIDIPLRGYYKDTTNALTKNKINKGNIYLWAHNINNDMDYFFYDIPRFLKSFVGVSMCGFANKMKLRDILKIGKKFYTKIGIIMFLPIGFVIYLYKRRK